MARPALAASRAMDVLNFLAANPSEAFSLSELVQHLGLNFASCHALLTAMTREGYLERHPKHKTYSLGPALVAIGHAALEAHPAIDIVRDEARDLANELDLEVLVTARTGGDLIAIARAGRYVAPNASLRVGQRIPLIPPLGAQFMAWAPTEQVERWLAEEPAEARPRHREILTAVRRQGYVVTMQTPLQSKLGEVVANLSLTPHSDELRQMMTGLITELGHNVYHLEHLDRAQHYKVGLMSAPVFNAFGNVAYTLSLLGFAEPLGADGIEGYAAKLMARCMIATRKSNGRVPFEVPDDTIRMSG